MRNIYQRSVLSHSTPSRAGTCREGARLGRTDILLCRHLPDFPFLLRKKERRLCLCICPWNISGHSTEALGWVQAEQQHTRWTFEFPKSRWRRRKIHHLLQPGFQMCSFPTFICSATWSCSFSDCKPGHKPHSCL